MMGMARYVQDFAIPALPTAVEIRISPDIHYIHYM
jgi:hypothetical protein